MNKLLFWQLIDTARDISPFNNLTMKEHLNKQLAEHSQEERDIFALYLTFYYHSLETAIDLKMACKVLQGYSSEDMFHGFRLWIISLGEERFLKTYHSADSLSEITLDLYSEKEREFPELLDSAQNHPPQLTPAIVSELQQITPKSTPPPVFKDEKAFLQEIPHFLPNLTTKVGFTPAPLIAEIEEQEARAKALQEGKLSPQEALTLSLGNLFTKIGLDTDTIDHLTSPLSQTSKIDNKKDSD